MDAQSLRRAYDLRLAEATRLAGGLTDLAQRATVYHHLFRASGGNHVFPLIAAHGALWAGGYFRRALRLGRLLAWQYGWSPALRRRRLGQLENFANAFRDINRQVCVDTYANYYFTRDYGAAAQAADIVAPELLAVLNPLHTAARAGRELPDAEKRAVFLAHFLNEQQQIVGPAIERAVAAFEWPLVRFLALRPRIRFAFFPGRTCFWFRNFAVKEERIAKGLQAFECASAVGWTATENALEKYAVLPAAFFIDPVTYFSEFRAAFLAAA